MRVIIRRYKQEHYTYNTEAVVTHKATVDQAMRTEVRRALKVASLQPGRLLYANLSAWGGEVGYVDEENTSHRIIITEVDHD